MREYLYVDQLAELTPWTPDGIRTMISRGAFRQGVHFFKPGGRYGRPIFSWKAVVEFIEKSKRMPESNDDRIVLADGAVIDLDEAAEEIHRLCR